MMEGFFIYLILRKGKADIRNSISILRKRKYARLIAGVNQKTINPIATAADIGGLVKPCPNLRVAACQLPGSVNVDAEP